MNPIPITELEKALSAPQPSTRLTAALAAGTHPDPATALLLVQRCGVESDFYVRDMLTWALTRLPRAEVVPRLLAELRSARARARSQALHTLSKIGDPDLWPGLPPELLHDPDDEVAQSAWRAAVVLVPDAARQRLADELTAELGRGGLDLHRSLSRAFVALDDVAEPALDRIADTGDARAQAHVRSTRALLADPDSGFDASLFEAKRTAALEPSGQ